jgi:hypothetical protein
MQYCISKDLLYPDTFQVHGANNELLGTILELPKGAYKAISRIDGKMLLFMNIKKAAAWLYKHNAVKPALAMQFDLFG